MANSHALALDNATSIPAGFREEAVSGSGLIVPEELSRVREVITQAQWKHVNRAITEVCIPFNLKFVWMCNDERCTKQHGEMMKRVRTAHGFYLECGHRRLVYDPKV